MTTKVHSVAEAGFGTGTNELYDRARPSYQADALAAIKVAVPSKEPLKVVELGAGTGLFTRAFLKHPDFAESIAEIKALEPSAGMREVFDKKTQDPRLTSGEGTFDTTHVEDSWADLITIAQAFHWCPDYDAASAEFARILKPNGVVAFIWNLEDRNTAAWVAQLRDRLEKHENGTPQFRLGLWRATWDTPSYQKHFKPPVEQTWSYHIPGTVEGAIERAGSKSYIQTLAPSDREAALADVKRIVEQGDGMKWIDKDAGIFEYPYNTLLVLAHKK
ncbi:S-adenosyl-L-methionine-dependent methyltransferase [Cylindrobasidium torrendii FP15055 ss-10]|uniref:S-adenosyl-L-methionine-dependent methyltransferase n=1 Tax=Cylindrobasidium torrendii FP15055 ss-10 TaxID=1314674 RepID=A0A0D7BP44_9AGAR|nr:S-adenosyl-L-methionine-dependent methyltransferase [Cylindrobasidium torrendii FP15055 ss-10]